MSLNTKQTTIELVGCIKRRLLENNNDNNDQIGPAPKRSRVDDDENVKDDSYSFEPKSPDYPPSTVIQQQQQQQQERSSIDTLKDVTLSLLTDFTHMEQRAQNYGYDFKVLDYFDVEPNYDCETLQQQVQPILCPMVNGTSVYTNNDRNKNVLTDNANDIYEGDDTMPGIDGDDANNNSNNNYGTYGVDEATYNDEALVNDTITMKNLNIKDDGDNNISKDNNKQFKFTKTKRNYISMYLNINNIPILCNTCYGLNCICKE